MKVLVISNFYPPVVRGGYELECATVVEILRERGDDVRVLTTRPNGVKVVDDAFVARDLHLLTEERKSHVLAPVTTVRDRRAARAHLQEMKPDLVFVWNGGHISHAVVYDVLASGTPTAFRICEHWFGKMFVDDFLLRYVWNGADFGHPAWARTVRALNKLPPWQLKPSLEASVAICWVSDYMRRNVPVPKGLHPALQRVIHPTTLRAAQFEAVNREGASDRHIAFAGRLSYEKGARVLVAALAQLVRDGHDATLTLAGTGSPTDLERVREVAAEAGVLDRCTFAGQLDTEQLCRLLGEATLLVIPSVWEEPLPITAIEGALARIPIVASRSGGIPEALTEGEEALLAAPGDPDELAAAIAGVFARPEEAEERAARAYHRWSTRTAEAHAEAMRQFVDDALRELSPSAAGARRLTAPFLEG